MTDQPRRRIAFGCKLSSPDEPDAKAVWIGRLVGYQAIATRRGCWHAEIACYTQAGTAIAAEICMPTQHHLIESLRFFDGISDDKKVEFITEHLPKIAAHVDAKERAEIRARILG